MLYIYYNQLQWLGVNFGLTGEYVELSFKQPVIWFLYFFSISNSLGSSPDWEHCIVFLGETLSFHSASLCSQVYK